MSHVHPLPHRAETSLARRAIHPLLIGLVTLDVHSGLRSRHRAANPINYSTATPRNAVSRLQDRIVKGTTKLEFESDHGYLRSVLRELDVSESSQVLVFSKTSLQRDRITPKTPRAIYFNDDVMVGFCLRGGVIELSAADEVVGTAFFQHPRPDGGEVRTATPDRVSVLPELTISVS